MPAAILWAAAAIAKVAAWLLAQALLWPVVRFGVVLGIVAAVFAWMPWSSYTGAVSSYAAAIPPGLMWGLEAMAIPTGLAIILGAYVLRFFVRFIRAALGG